MDCIPIRGLNMSDEKPTLPTFDYWKDLYENDPEEFDKQRKEIIEVYLEYEYPNEPEKIKRGLALINGVDMRVQHLKHPLARLAKVEELFHEQFAKFNETLQAFKDVNPSNLIQTFEPTIKTTDNVLKFKPQSSDIVDL